MKSYSVKFWYYTDLRCDWTGDAYDDCAAIQMALIHHRLNQWVIGPGFRLELSSG